MERTSQFSLKRAGEPPGIATRGIAVGMGFLAGTEIFYFADKVAGVAELAIYRGKAYIGDIIHFFQAVHDFFTNGCGGNLPAVFLFEVFQYFIDGFFDQFGADRALFARFLEAEDKFAAVKGFVASVAFDGSKIFTLDLFVSGESIVT